MSAQTDVPGVARQLQRLTTATMRYSDRAGAARGLHRSDLMALQVVVEARLSGDRPLTASQLAAELALTPSATTALLDRLEGVGHLRREHDPADRRRLGIHATQQAGTEARAIFGPLAHRMEQVADDFTDAEMQVVGRFLTAAAEAIERQPLPDV